MLPSPENRVPEDPAPAGKAESPSRPFCSQSIFLRSTMAAGPHIRARTPTSATLGPASRSLNVRLLAVATFPQRRRLSEINKCLANESSELHFSTAESDFNAQMFAWTCPSCPLLMRRLSVRLRGRCSDANAAKAHLLLHWHGRGRGHGRGLEPEIPYAGCLSAADARTRTSSCRAWGGGANALELGTVNCSVIAMKRQIKSGIVPRGSARLPPRVS